MYRRATRRVTRPQKSRPTASRLRKAGPTDPTSPGATAHRTHASDRFVGGVLTQVACILARPWILVEPFGLPCRARHGPPRQLAAATRRSTTYPDQFEERFAYRRSGTRNGRLRRKRICDRHLGDPRVSWGGHGSVSLGVDGRSRTGAGTPRRGEDRHDSQTTGLHHSYRQLVPREVPASQPEHEPASRTGRRMIPVTPFVSSQMGLAACPRVARGVTARTSSRCSGRPRCTRRLRIPIRSCTPLHCP